MPHLALKHYVVVSINLRLAPKYNIVEQLIDVKRAIRWTRQNIESFGGDAKFIAIAGSSSGAHLATMAAMTQNHKEYQPNFETVDTSIQACVSIAGYYDATRNWGYKFDQFFNTNIVGLDQNTDLTRQFSPTWRLKEAEVSKSRVTATDDERLGPNLPPFLIIQFYNTNNSGKGDCLAPIRHVREFVKEFKVTCRSTCTIQCIELPNANHYFSIWSSPRSHILSYGIEPFLRHQFENFKKKE